jgi:hypothetical protein
MRQQSVTRAGKYKKIIKLFMRSESGDGYSGAFLVLHGLQRQ